MLRIQLEAMNMTKNKEETKRNILNNVVKKAQNLYNAGKFMDAAKLWQKAALISQELTEIDLAAEYSARANEIREKITELKNEWKIGQKATLESKMREALCLRRTTIENEREKILQKAGSAEAAGDLLEVSSAYKLASKLSLEIGERDQAREFNEKAKEAKQRNRDYRHF